MSAIASTQAQAGRSLLAADSGLMRRRAINALATFLIWAASALGVVLLALILGYVVVRGLPAINLPFFTERPLPYGEVGGGVAPAILGSLTMMIVASIIGVPIGVGTAI